MTTYEQIARTAINDFAAAKIDFETHRREDDGWSARWHRLVAMEQVLVRLAKENP
jgi:hypothetical protein